MIALKLMAWMLGVLLWALCFMAAIGYVRIGSWMGGKKRMGIFGNERISRGWPTFKPGGRWGVFILGLEIGSRDPRDPIGCWLKDHGWWRW